MVSERVQRRIDRLLDDAEQALARFDWDSVRQCDEAVLRFDPNSGDALSFLEAANRGPGSDHGLQSASDVPGPAEPSKDTPTSFADGRYKVERLLGEGYK